MIDFIPHMKDKLENYFVIAQLEDSDILWYIMAKNISTLNLLFIQPWVEIFYYWFCIGFLKTKISKKKLFNSFSQIFLIDWRKFILGK